MKRPLKILLLILSILAVFTLGKWFILDRFLADQQSGRYRATEFNLGPVPAVVD